MPMMDSWAFLYEKIMSNQLNRQFQNQNSIGTVIAVDAAKGKIRLKVGDNETDWISIPAMATGVVKIWRCPTIGEQFSLTAQGGELSNSVPQASLWSDDNPPPSTDPDEVFIQLGDQSIVVNTKTGEANFKLTKCTFDCAETHFKGKVLVDETLDADGKITSKEDVEAQGISLTKHKTSGVKGGSDESGVPIP